MKINFEMPPQKDVPGKDEKPGNKVPPQGEDLKITFNKPAKKEVPVKVEKPSERAPAKADDQKVDWIPRSAPRRREPGKSLVEFQERKQVLEDIVSNFFEKYPYAKESFEKDPEMMRSFRAGLAVLMDTSLKIENSTPAGLKDDKKFEQDVLKLSFTIEDEGKDRRRKAGR